MSIKNRLERLEQKQQPAPPALENDPVALMRLWFSAPETTEDRKDEMECLRRKAFALIVEAARRGDFLEAAKRRNIDLTLPVVRDEDATEGEA